MVSIVQSREVIDTAEIALQCSHCQSTNQTDALRVRTVDKLYGLIPVWVTQETVVKCPGCGTIFTTQAGVDELQLLSADAITKEFRIRVGFVQKFLVTIAWLLFWLFPISTILFLIARFLVPKTALRWRRATTTGLIASVISPILFFGFMMILDLLAAK
ncbi:hypothetical protein Q31a_43070 [Aureliella helgolandensis]|uniref:Uncharacterized protein n=1 Tax=Aureliella helgolandensis TaxID=2527968 RepID=A0A518GBG5_9BACT|nr:hypothetical protein Q31a_43070 [Aureliella helgolandensis]